MRNSHGTHTAPLPAAGTLKRTAACNGYHPTEPWSCGFCQSRLQGSRGRTAPTCGRYPGREWSADAPAGRAGPRGSATRARGAHRPHQRRRGPGSDSHGAARSGRASPRPRPSATGSRACLWWRRRSGPKWSTDRAAPRGDARACALAHAVRWRGTAGGGRMGSAGSSRASPGGDLALAGHTRPHGCPKDPRLFKRSVTSPRPNGVVPPP
jgi:hypothetical protein